MPSLGLLNRLETAGWLGFDDPAHRVEVAHGGERGRHGVAGVDELLAGKIGEDDLVAEGDGDVAGLVGEGSQVAAVERGGGAEGDEGGFEVADLAVQGFGGAECGGLHGFERAGVFGGRDAVQQDAAEDEARQDEGRRQRRRG